MKEIIDVCCGSRMFWFNKQNPNVIFNDIRKEEHILCDGRKLKINPDTQHDFRKLPYKNNSFSLVVFDPPHLKQLGKNSWMAKKYGVLSENWEKDLKKGFDECWRILKKNGVLIFKWNEQQIRIKEILKIFGKQPLFGHPTKQKGQTKWMCFMKIYNQL
jgi:SAM-dependent methyltransferase